MTLNGQPSHFQPSTLTPERKAPYSGPQPQVGPGRSSTRNAVPRNIRTGSSRVIAFVNAICSILLDWFLTKHTSLFTALFFNRTHGLKALVSLNFCQDLVSEVQVNGHQEFACANNLLERGRKAECEIKNAVVSCRLVSRIVIYLSGKNKLSFFYSNSNNPSFA